MRSFGQTENVDNGVEKVVFEAPYRNHCEAQRFVKMRGALRVRWRRREVNMKPKEVKHGRS